MRLIRALCLCLIALIPLATLFHPDDRGRWDVQRSAMSAPDEFSYLLMAQHFLHGGGLSLRAQLGQDTFYPPGFPLLLAAWGKAGMLFTGATGLTAFGAHALNASLLCAAVVVVYLFARRLLLRGPDPRLALSRAAAGALALLVAALFATNWHVLDTSLLIMSEPAFMLATFAWLATALRWPDWPTRPERALWVALLAVIAWSIRGAGIVCVGTTLLYLAFHWWRHGTPDRRQRTLRIAVMVMAVVLPLIYQAGLKILSPEKSLASGNTAANSYTQQLLRGVLDIGPAGKDDPHPALSRVRGLAMNLETLVMSHLDDYAQCFVPPLRENPDYHFRNIIGKCVGLLGLAGWAANLLAALRRHRTESAPAMPRLSAPPSRAGAPTESFLCLFVTLYMALYLIWPFNFARFWSPIMPIMLVYGVHACQVFSDAAPRMGAALGRAARPRRAVLAGVLLGLLLALSAEEVAMRLGFYARRLNYVSDSLRDATRAVVRSAPDGRTLVTGMGSDELFAMAWYFGEQTLPPGKTFIFRAPDPTLPRNPSNPSAGRGELADAMLLRSLADAGDRPIFFLSYFPGIDARDTLASLQKQRPQTPVKKIFQKEIIVTVWEIGEGPVAPPVSLISPGSPGAGRW